LLDPDSGVLKWPTNLEKSKEFSCFEVLDVLSWGLKASPVSYASFMEASNFLTKKYPIFFQL
jgi:hypothetical protein